MIVVLGFDHSNRKTAIPMENIVCKFCAFFHDAPNCRSDNFSRQCLFVSIVIRLLSHLTVIAGVMNCSLISSVEHTFTQHIEVSDQLLSPSMVRGCQIMRDTRPQSIMRTNIMQFTLNDIQRAVNLDAKRCPPRSFSRRALLILSRSSGYNVCRWSYPDAAS